MVELGIFTLAVGLAVGVSFITLRYIVDNLKLPRD